MDSQRTRSPEIIGDHRPRTVKRQEEARSSPMRGLTWLDERFLRPTFVRRFTPDERRASTAELNDLARSWSEVQRRGRAGRFERVDSESAGEEGDVSRLFQE